LFATETAIKNIQQKTVSSIRTAGYMFLSAGFVFVAFALIPLFDGHWQVAVLTLPMGFIFLVLSFFRFRALKR